MLRFPTRGRQREWRGITGCRVSAREPESNQVSDRPQNLSQYRHAPAELENGQVGRRNETASSEFYSKLSLWLFRHPRLYESLREIRNLGQRIRMIWQQAKAPSVYMGPVWQKTQTGNYQPDTRTHARKLGIKALLGSRPWATVEDCRFFLQGWDAAERFYGDSRHSDTLPTSVRASVRAYESRDGNSMPPPEAPQASKCDP